jgi:parallel beta-helix repeat protein
MNKTVLTSFTISCLLFTVLGLSLNIQPVEASGTIYIRADGSIEPLTANITSADNVTYTFTDHINGSIIVEKDDIIIDGLGYSLQGSHFQTRGTDIGINVWHIKNVTIKNLRISGFLFGIFLNESSNNNIHQNNITANIFGSVVHKSSWNNSISGNNITNNWNGINLYYASNNTVYGNNITNNEYGIQLESTSNNIVSGNHVTGSMYDGIWLNNSYNNIFCRNNITNNGKSETPESCNGILLRNSSNNFISGNNITTNKNDGIYVEDHSNYNRISRNNITNNDDGILLLESSNNTVSGNDVKNNDGGIFLWYSSNNWFYHSNFINNTVQAYCLFSINIWNNDVEGNYWSNYTGFDLNHDGIGDTNHTIDANNTDKYPLMGPFNSFDTAIGKNVNVISNSTVEDFEYFESNSTIRMHVSNMTGDQTHGFIRINIPHALMSEPYNITIEGANPTYWNYTLYDNGTHRWIYFEYEHSTLEIIIIPEFPSFLILPLFMIATLLAVIVYKRKHTMQQGSVFPNHLL